MCFSLLQISDSFKKFGISDSDSDVLVVVITSDKALEKVCLHKWYMYMDMLFANWEVRRNFAQGSARSIHSILKAFSFYHSTTLLKLDQTESWTKVLYSNYM